MTDWKLVPAEPTKEMLDAAAKVSANELNPQAKRYAAMLAAAPTPPVQEPVVPERKVRAPKP